MLRRRGKALGSTGEGRLWSSQEIKLTNISCFILFCYSNVKDQVATGEPIPAAKHVIIWLLDTAWSLEIVQRVSGAQGPAVSSLWHALLADVAEESLVSILPTLETFLWIHS